MIEVKPVVALLVLLQGVSVAFLWVVAPVSGIGAGRFAIFLAVDLLSFAIVAYAYTHENWAESVERVWVLMGSIGLIILLIASLYFP